MKGLVTRSEIGLDLAMSALAGVRDAADLLSVALGITVVDGSGAVVASVRMDGAQLVAVELATDKAFTAAAFGEPTEVWAESTAPGGSNWGMTATCGGRLVVLAGGLPLHHHGALIGAIGVSGASAAIDRDCAIAGMRAAGCDFSGPSV